MVCGVEETQIAVTNNINYGHYQHYRVSVLYRPIPLERPETSDLRAPEQVPGDYYFAPRDMCSVDSRLYFLRSHLNT